MLQVPGHGRNLALLLIDGNAQVRNAFVTLYPPNFDAAAAIAAVPPGFSSKLEAYKHIDILKLIVFYNETFDIVGPDDLATRVNKFRRFLTEF